MVRRRRPNPLIFLIAALVVVATGFWQQQQQQQQQQPRQQSGAPASPAAVPAPSPPTVPASSPPPAAESAPVRLAQVPAGERPQLEQTLALIAKGGPFPYSKDGTVFQNRERKLPQRPRGYYREYTVPTPGAPNRGARRVVQGRDGDTWYTSDHYKTFVRIDE